MRNKYFEEEIFDTKFNEMENKYFNDERYIHRSEKVASAII